MRDSYRDGWQSGRKAGFLIGILFLLYLFSAALQDGPERPELPPEPGPFQHCIDGDTCYWRDMPPVRLIGIDAPELDEEMYALDARNALQAQIEGADSVAIRWKCYGKHGRLIARVLADGRDLSKWMLRHGYAREYTGRECYD